MDSIYNQARGRYPHLEKIKPELRTVLGAYTGLRLEYTPYVYNNGRSEMLLTLKGVIPVSYRGAKYNIPIAIRLMTEYPYKPPLCSVEPTPDMRINVSKYVGHDGRIYMPYLSEWRHGSSDLYGLIQVMTAIFMETTPLNSVVNSPPSQPPTPAYGACPYPIKPAFLPMPGVGGPTPNTGAPTPPYPSYPYPHPTPMGMPGGGGGGGGSPAPPPPGATGTPPYPAGPVRPAYGAGNASTITEEDRRASLLSAVEDKVRRKLGEIFAQYQAEMGVLQNTKKELTDGERKLQSIIGKLDAEKKELDDKIDLMKEKKKEVEDALDKMEKKQGEMNIDEAVVPSAPLYKQIFDLYAEENATQDAIYYLGEGLRRNVVDLETYLKQVRELSRKQFLLRAHLQKCRKVARLAG